MVKNKKLLNKVKKDQSKLKKQQKELRDNKVAKQKRQSSIEKSNSENKTLKASLATQRNINVQLRRELADTKREFKQHKIQEEWDAIIVTHPLLRLLELSEKHGIMTFTQLRCFIILAINPHAPYMRVVEKSGLDITKLAYNRRGFSGQGKQPFKTPIIKIKWRKTGDARDNRTALTSAGKKFIAEMNKLLGNTT